MNQIKEMNEEAYNWLMAIPTRAWCKHAFNYHPRCDVLMNNLSESFNATILLARDKPILTMLEWIRTYTMGRFATMNEKLQKYNGKIMPRPLKRLSIEVQGTGNWLPTRSAEHIYEVQHIISDERFVVDLRNFSCSCNFW